MEWTYENPGEGNMVCFEDAQTWLTDCKTALDDAYNDLNKVDKSLPSVWTGKGASSFANAIEQRMKDLHEAEDAIDAVAQALKAYVLEVEEIKNEARKEIENRDAAYLLKSQTYMDSTTHPPSDDEIAQRKRVHDDAVTDYDDAVSKLQKLGDRRAEADKDLSSAVMVEKSTTWGSNQYYSYFDDSHRDAANDMVWELFEDFRSGKGDRTRFFGEGDDFTEWLRQSSHIESTRTQIREGILNGTLTEGNPQVNNRVISNNPIVLVGDGLNVSTVGKIGNLPESFLGSYELEYTIDSIDQYGVAEITYTINNDTTIDSFTRIPGTGGTHMWYYDDLVAANTESGMWESTHQTIVWTEQIQIPGYVYPGELV